MRPKFDYRALGRLPAGQMNKLEAAYAAHLELLKASGDIKYWKFEPMSFKLAPLTTYKPDFLILRKDDMAIFDEVKGFMTDDANAKIKIAASMFPFQFRIVRKAGKAGGMWSIQNVGPDDAEAA
jgi:hypothetical protein